MYALWSQQDSRSGVCLCVTFAFVDTRRSLVQTVIKATESVVIARLLRLGDLFGNEIDSD